MYNDKLLFMIMIKINVQNTLWSNDIECACNIDCWLRNIYNKCQICTFTNNHCGCLLFILGGVHCLIVFKVLCTGLIHHCQNYHAYTHTIQLESVSGSDVFKFLWNLQKITQIYNIKKKKLKREFGNVFSLSSQQLLGYPEICTYFTWCSVQLLRHTLLFDRIHWVEHFTQVSIYHILQWQKTTKAVKQLSITASIESADSIITNFPRLLSLTAEALPLDSSWEPSWVISKC